MAVSNSGVGPRMPRQQHVIRANNELLHAAKPDCLGIFFSLRIRPSVEKRYLVPALCKTVLGGPFLRISSTT